jgi:hypothetical protein
MIRFKPKKEKNRNIMSEEEFIKEAKADGNSKTKTFCLTICTASNKSLIKLDEFWEKENYSKTIEKMILDFDSNREMQEEFAKWKEEFLYPSHDKIVKSYHLQTATIDILKKLRKKFKIRYNSEMLRFLLLFYEHMLL